MKKILMIDDSPFLYAQFKNIFLKDFNFEYLQILDPFKTQETIDEYKPDLIILDVNFNLPIDGLELGLFIKKNYDIPIIYFSGVGLDTAKEIIDKVNPECFILKLSYSDDLIKIILYNIIKKVERAKKNNTD